MAAQLLKPRDVAFLATNDLARFHRVPTQFTPMVNQISQTWNMEVTSKSLFRYRVTERAIRP